MQSHSMRIGRNRIANRKFTEGHTSPIDLCYPNGKMLLSFARAPVKENLYLLKRNRKKNRMKYGYTWNTHYRTRAYGESKTHSLHATKLKLKPNAKNSRSQSQKINPQTKERRNFYDFLFFSWETQKSTQNVWNKQITDHVRKIWYLYILQHTIHNHQIRTPPNRPFSEIHASIDITYK